MRTHETDFHETPANDGRYTVTVTVETGDNLLNMRVSGATADAWATLNVTETVELIASLTRGLAIVARNDRPSQLGGEMREALVNVGLDPVEIERDEASDYCEHCGHFHRGDQECRPSGPCGDYRCCIND